MSADPLDDASQHEQEMRDDGIAEARRKQEAKVLRPIGICYNCLDEITEGLYCDDECKKDHIHRLIGMRGKPRPSDLVAKQPLGEAAELGRGRIARTPSASFVG